MKSFGRTWCKSIGKIKFYRMSYRKFRLFWCTSSWVRFQGKKATRMGRTRLYTQWFSPGCISILGADTCWWKATWCWTATWTCSRASDHKRTLSPNLGAIYVCTKGTRSLSCFASFVSFKKQMRKRYFSFLIWATICSYQSALLLLFTCIVIF